MSENLNLELDWSKAKSLQIAIAQSKIHIKEKSETMKELEEIEKILEDFTQTASMVVYIDPNR